MCSVSDAAKTVSDFFNTHARKPDLVGKPTLFASDVNGTLDADPNLDQFLSDVLDMGDRLQGIETKVKIMTGNSHQTLSFSAVEKLKASGDGDWLVEKPDLTPLWKGGLEVAFDDESSVRKLIEDFAKFGFCPAVAAVDPASDECKGLLSAWHELGQTDDGKDVRDQVFQAWYDGQPFEI